jgi:hypothetical protein
MTRWLCLVVVAAALIGHSVAAADRTGGADPASRLPAQRDVVIDIDGLDDVRIGGAKHTFTSLRQQFADAPPRRVVVRKTDTTTIGLASGMDEFLSKSGLAKEMQVGNEQIWSIPKPKAPDPVAPAGPATVGEVVIDIDGTDNIRIGGTKQTLTSLRQQFADTPPRRVVVRKTDTTTIGLASGMDEFLSKSGFAREMQVGNEQIWSVPRGVPWGLVIGLASVVLVVGGGIAILIRARCRRARVDV